MSIENPKIVYYISILTFILGVLGFLFGDNLLERFSGPELNMTSTKVQMNLPNKIEEVVSDYSEKNDISHMPDSYRVIEIYNNGSSPSKDLRLVLNLDGYIYDHKIESTEKINQPYIEKNKMTIEVERLSPNAKIVLQLWFKNVNKTFQVTYADDNNSKEIQKDNLQDKITIFEYAMIILSLVSTGAFVYLKSNFNSRKNLKKVNFEKDELETRVRIILDHLKEESDEIESEPEPEIEKDEEIQFKRLQEFIKNSRKNS
ncbi:hypothetical protein [Peribacillus frigoritolerans]|uniref:hypothetical protein n=1 Tax=Peribacillus frigoritolerans TaxID=450367 RepID=UPI002E1F2D66|nr:hypothetical protein [Peribacillus frigoritolerans]